MFKSYITLAVRNIVKDKLYAFINLAALFVAWATTAGHAWRGSPARARFTPCAANNRPSIEPGRH